MISCWSSRGWKARKSCEVASWSPRLVPPTAFSYTKNDKLQHDSWGYSDVLTYLKYIRAKLTLRSMAYDMTRCICSLQVWKAECYVRKKKNMNREGTARLRSVENKQWESRRMFVFSGCRQYIGNQSWNTEQRVSGSTQVGRNGLNFIKALTVQVVIKIRKDEIQNIEHEGRTCGVGWVIHEACSLDLDIVQKG